MKAIQYILRYFNNKKILKRAIIIGNFEIYNSAKIVLRHGSFKTDIQIDENFRFFGGKIVSFNHGKITIGHNTQFGFNLFLGCSNRIDVGNYVFCSDNVTIMDNNNHPIHPQDRLIMLKQPYDTVYRTWKYSDSKPIKIGDNVWIGHNVRINKGITIGDNSIIAACSVVTKDVPSNAIAAGNPAVIVRTNIDTNYNRIITEI